MTTFSTLAPQYELLGKAPFAWADWFTFYRFLAGNPDPRKQEGFYHRCVYAPAKHEYCVQVVLYYRRQLFPYHVNDYHPLYAYFNESYQLVRLLYDASHHQARCAPLAQHYALAIRFPWHGYHLGSSYLSVLFHASHFDLTDDVLRGWWLQSGMPQFKVRSKFFDPWNPGLMPHDQTPGNFRDEAICPYCGAIELLDAMTLEDGIWRIQLRCRNDHRFAAVYDSSRMHLECVKI
jgi:hypothetical protein